MLATISMGPPIITQPIIFSPENENTLRPLIGGELLLLLVPRLILNIMITFPQVNDQIAFRGRSVNYGMVEYIINDEILTVNATYKIFNDGRCTVQFTIIIE